MLEEPTAIVLIGVSSAGKTATALELRHRLARPAMFFSGDDFDLPQSSEAVRLLRAQGLAELWSWERRFYSAFFGAMAAVVATGMHAIGEMIFKADHHVAAYEGALVDTRRLLIRLVAPMDVCLSRERARQDRRDGTAMQTAAEEVLPQEINATIDTSELAISEVASRIHRLLLPSR